MDLASEKLKKGDSDLIFHATFCLSCNFLVLKKSDSWVILGQVNHGWQYHNGQSNSGYLGY